MTKLQELFNAIKNFISDTGIDAADKAKVTELSGKLENSFGTRYFSTRSAKVADILNELGTIANNNNNSDITAKTDFQQALANYASNMSNFRRTIFDALSNDASPTNWKSSVFKFFAIPKSFAGLKNIKLSGTIFSALLLVMLGSAIYQYFIKEQEVDFNILNYTLLGSGMFLAMNFTVPVLVSTAVQQITVTNVLYATGLSIFGFIITLIGWYLGRDSKYASVRYLGKVLSSMIGFQKEVKPVARTSFSSSQIIGGMLVIAGIIGGVSYSMGLIPRNEENTESNESINA